jgi:hypothetical protein
MPDNRDSEQSRSRAMARLATLQSMKEQARQENKVEMLKAIESMIDQELELLREGHGEDSKPA